eukprot:3568989-Amphidinium_carterae.1
MPWNCDPVDVDLDLGTQMYQWPIPASCCERLHHGNALLIARTRSCLLPRSDGGLAEVLCADVPT